MQKNHIGKILAIGIVVIFIGVSYSSAISIDTKSSVVNQQSYDDCNCEEIDSRHLIILERQLNRLEVFSKLLVVLSRYNPELVEINEELTSEIINLKNLFNRLNSNLPPPENIIICLIIAVPLYLTILLQERVDALLNNYKEFPLIYNIIYYSIWIPLEYIIIFGYELGYKYECLD